MKNISKLFYHLALFNLCYCSVHPLVHGQFQLSQQYLRIAETSMHSLIPVLQLTLITFMYISNGLSAVNGHKFYVCTNMPNYDID